MNPDLTREDIIGLLTEVGQYLHDRGVRGELFVVGGAAMALAFDARRTTNDVDAVFEPKDIVYEAARHVAATHEGLPATWINDAVKGFLPGNDNNVRIVLDVPGLRVSAPSAEYLLALKVYASRPDRDGDDIEFLADYLGLTTANQVLDVAERYFHRSQLSPKTQFFIQQIFGEGGAV
ncbi:DUF6036 family nucleotidyltransferase [Mycobacterium intracellulare]|uniref:DUF6036 family nucleotidyltransferase n=1 Tax=Mycobacterium intracellulare subsp. chimaera TaxID=222805 RepID=A0ABT7PAR2_MYCIT|nr:DUF6036 family nucleotidyltransferase [Mycobacterium intracellulare]MDM3930161.1 DUF6036 family nucleotidyltransferase [Mycobacterium intracellulare subsp. chimaera]